MDKRNNYCEHRLVCSKKELSIKEYHRRFKVARLLFTLLHFGEFIGFLLLVPKEPAEKAITLNLSAI